MQTPTNTPTHKPSVEISREQEFSGPRPYFWGLGIFISIHFRLHYMTNLANRQPKSCRKKGTGFFLPSFLTSHTLDCAPVAEVCILFYIPIVKAELTAQLIAHNFSLNLDFVARHCFVSKPTLFQRAFYVQAVCGPPVWEACVKLHILRFQTLFTRLVSPKVGPEVSLLKRPAKELPCT